MARTNNTLTLTADELNAIITQAVATAMGTQKVQPKKGTKAPTKADMERKDGTVRKDGKVWWVSADGSKREWVTAKSYEYICNKRAYASGEKTHTSRTDEEKAEFKDKYAKKWDKWTKSKEYKALSKSERKDANKAMHKQIIAELSK